jgi:hypothetical protein
MNASLTLLCIHLISISHYLARGVTTTAPAGAATGSGLFPNTSLNTNTGTSGTTAGQGLFGNSTGTTAGAAGGTHQLIRGSVSETDAFLYFSTCVWFSEACRPGPLWFGLGRFHDRRKRPKWWRLIRWWNAWCYPSAYRHIYQLKYSRRGAFRECQASG